MTAAARVDTSSAAFLARIEAKAEMRLRMREQKAAMAEVVEITIVAGWSDAEIERRARRYAENTPGFTWSNRVARASIRHRLTNYEELLHLFDRRTGYPGYRILRARMNALVDATYPSFRDDTGDVATVSDQFGFSVVECAAAKHPGSPVAEPQTVQ